jgi:hypothetical protein
MNWKKLLVGIAILIGTFLLYKMRKWDYYKGDGFVSINKMRAFNTWMVITMGTIAGIVCILQSL